MNPRHTDYDLAPVLSQVDAKGSILHQKVKVQEAVAHPNRPKPLQDSSFKRTLLVTPRNPEAASTQRSPFTAIPTVLGIASPATSVARLCGVAAGIQKRSAPCCSSHLESGLVQSSVNRHQFRVNNDSEPWCVSQSSSAAFDPHASAERCSCKEGVTLGVQRVVVPDGCPQVAQHGVAK